MKQTFESLEGEWGLSYEEVMSAVPEIVECAKLLGEIPMWDAFAEPNQFGLHLSWIPFEMENA